MHIRITRGTIDPGRADEVVALQDDLAEAIGRLPGFGSYHAGLDRRSGAIVAITTWETEEAASWSRESLGDVLTRVLELSKLEPAEIFEVIKTA
jgi:quinol monooxygenase YgiN